MFLKPLALFGSDGGRISSIKRPVKVLATLTILLAVLFLVHMELRVSGEFNIRPLHNADVRAEIEGIIKSIHVKEGDLIEKGHLIAYLSVRDCG